MTMQPRAALPSLRTVTQYFGLTRATSGEVGVIDASWPVGDVRRYGGDPTGTADSGDAIANAIASLGTAPGRVYLPTGTYKTSRTFVVSGHRQHIVGDGPYATIVYYTGAAGSVLTFSAGVAILAECSIRGVSFQASDTTHNKIAVSVRDASCFVMEDCSVGIGTNWTGAGSIGLQTQGRELSTFNRLILLADIPLSIEPNANAPRTSEDCDHFHFCDLYLLPNATNPCVVIADGVTPTNLTFDGYQAWVGGGYGLYWSDTTSVSAAQNLVFRGVRYEQGQLATGYAVYISRLATIEFVRFESVALGLASRGMYLRGCSFVTLANVNYAGSSIALDCDGSCDNVNWDNCFWQSGCTVTMTNLVDAFAPVRPGSGAYPDVSTATWTKTSNGTPWGRRFGIDVGAGRGTLASGANVIVPFTGEQTTGVVTVTAAGATQQEAATFSIGGAIIAVKKMAGTAKTADANVPNCLCLIASGGAFPQLVNNLGEAVTYSWTTEWTQ